MQNPERPLVAELTAPGSHQGAVALTSTACVAVMLGQPIANEADLLPFLHGGGQGTKNQRYMAAAAGLGAISATVRSAAELEADALLTVEEADGPGAWEIFAPDPHGGMYALAWVGVIAAGYRRGATPLHASLAARAAKVLGQMLCVGDLIAAPDGDLRGLPGMRAPTGAALARRSLSAVWVEVRRGQAGGGRLVQRGTGGRPRTLALLWSPANDPLIDGAAWWLRDLLGRAPARDLFDGPLSLAAPLPLRLRLPLTVYRWNGGTLASFADPGEALRAQYIISGSAAAKRDSSHKEKPTTWVKVVWGTPGHHHVEAGLAWESTPPPAPEGATRFDIPGPRDQAGTTPAQPPSTPKQPPTEARALDLNALADVVANLTVERSERDLVATLARELRTAPPPRSLSAIADDLAGLHIGAGQIQAPAWQRVIELLRAQGAKEAKG